MKKVLITGSSGLVGSDAVDFFHKKKFKIYALDNDLRAKLFGKRYSTNRIRLIQKDKYNNIIFLKMDIIDRKKIKNLFKENKFDLIIHTAGQPSHDWSAKDPVFDFDINAMGTLNLLDMTRLYSPKALFIFTSTNKVYGDTPNKLKGYVEKKTRYEVIQNKKLYSIDESMSIDYSKHSPFGVSKTSADLMVQEYGKYFGIKTVSFRCGCLTGPGHQGAELHGFLSYLVKCIVNDYHYNIFGYKGKQVRDNIHAFDLVNMFWHYYHKPGYGEVYNVGGGRSNSISIIETINITNWLLKKKWKKFKFVKKPRNGDHKWYITNFSKFQKKFRAWDLRYDNINIIEQIIKSNID